MGPMVLARARGAWPPARPRPVAVIASGETTVKVVGTGKGGRNQEMALSVATALAGESTDIALGSVGTDGIDGPTDAAGAYVDTTTITRAHASSRSTPRRFSPTTTPTRSSRASTISIITGPSTTNVGDIQIVLFR